MEKKRILLVNTNSEKNPYPVPPLGICLVAASLEGEYDVRVYDGMFDEGAHFIECVTTYRPHYVGIGIRNIDDMNPDNPTQYIGGIRERYVQPLRVYSDAQLILGGSGFSIFSKALIDFFGADYGVVGEGEGAFIALLRAIDSGEDPSGIQRVITSRGDKPINGSYYAFSTLPRARIHQKIDFNPYRERGSYPIQTKRGCAHACVYCTYTCIEGPRYRTRGAAEVVDEIEEAQAALGPVTFEFVDSTFNDPPGHAEAICKEIIRRGLRVRLRTMGINPAHVTPQLLEDMSAAGFAQIDCTPDTASVRMLVSFQKNFSMGELERTAKLIREFDMPTMWFFLFGGPGENAATVRETFDFIDRHVGALDMAHITAGLRVYPGTPLHAIAIREKVAVEGDPLIAPLFYFSRELPREELNGILNEETRKRPNCVPSTESRPAPEMMRDAMKLRGEQNLTEPMFRSLLRVRYRNMGKSPF